MARRIAVLVNPTAGRGRGARAAVLAVTRLRARGLRVDPMTATNANGASALAKQAVNAGYEALVAVGGDGMVHLVLQAVAGTGLAMGVIPAGTGNDFARMLGVPCADPGAAADVVAGGVVRRIDAGRAGDRWFAGVLAAGFDSQVNERANSMSWPRGRMRYHLALLAELGAFRPVPFAVQLDGRVETSEAMLVAVGNGSSYGGGMRICPSARLDDGLLSVTVVGRLSKPEFVRVFPRVYRGTHVSHQAVSVFSARQVGLSAPGVVAYADGERVGPLPLLIECVPAAVDMLVPEL